MLWHFKIFCCQFSVWKLELAYNWHPATVGILDSGILCSYHAFVAVDFLVIEQWEFGKQSLVIELYLSNHMLIWLVSEHTLCTNVVFHRCENLFFSICLKHQLSTLILFRSATFTGMKLCISVMEPGLNCWLVTRPNLEVFDWMTWWPDPVFDLSERQTPCLEFRTVIGYNVLWYDTNTFRVHKILVVSLVSHSEPEAKYSKNKLKIN